MILFFDGTATSLSPLSAIPISKVVGKPTLSFHFPQKPTLPLSLPCSLMRDEAILASLLSDEKSTVTLTKIPGIAQVTSCFELCILFCV